jgi:hypothetical protein
MKNVVLFQELLFFLAHQSLLLARAAQPRHPGTTGQPGAEDALPALQLPLTTLRLSSAHDGHHFALVERILAKPESRVLVPRSQIQF